MKGSVWSVHETLEQARLWAEEKAKRRKRRGGRLVPPLALFEAGLVVDSGSGMLAMLFFLVTFLFALFSLRLSSGLRCSASWAVMNQ